MTGDLSSSLSSTTDFLWDCWPLCSGRGCLWASVSQSIQWGQGYAIFSCILAVHSPSTQNLWWPPDV